MATLDDLLTHEREIQDAKAQLALEMERLDDSLARTHIRIAEVQNVNQDAATYNLASETLAAIFEAGPPALRS
jgi:hypothetical protein